MSSSSYDADVPSSSLKDADTGADAGCVLLCNLSEPELEEASLADCDEHCLVADNALSLAAPTTGDRCSTEPNNSESTSAHSDRSTSPQASIHAAPANRIKKRLTGQGFGAALRKKRKR